MSTRENKSFIFWHKKLYSRFSGVGDLHPVHVLEHLELPREELVALVVVFTGCLMHATLNEPSAEFQSHASQHLLHLGRFSIAMDFRLRARRRMATRSVDKWRARVAARHVLDAADRALFVCPGEDTAAICRLAWEAVDLASEATGALPPCTRDLLVCVVRTTFAAEQLLRCCRRQRFISSLPSGVSAKSANVDWRGGLG